MIISLANIKIEIKNRFDFLLRFCKDYLCEGEPDFCIEVTDEEAEEYLQKVAESIKAKADDVREYFGADFIKSEKKKDKAAAIIFDSAVEKKPKAKRTRAKAKKAEVEAEAEVKAETEEKAE